jgi:hypothetical protein
MVFTLSGGLYKTTLTIHGDYEPLEIQIKNDIIFSFDDYHLYIMERNSLKLRFTWIPQS